MIDPVKKNEQLKFITENIFNKIYSMLKSRPTAVLPSYQSAQKSREYQKMYGTYYSIKGFPLKQYDASDLIKLYKEKKIHNDTKLNIVNKGKKNKNIYFPFLQLLNREPFLSALAHDFRDERTPAPPKPDQTYIFAIPEKTKTGKPTFRSKKMKISQVVDFLIKNPSYKSVILIYIDSKSSYIPLKNTELWDGIEQLISHYS